MLVLTRKTDESIVIGGDIVVSVLGIEGDKVRLGIEAPKRVRVFRQELIEDTKEQNRRALESAFTGFDKSPLEGKD